jgi:serine/threonine-protein kinase
MGRVTSRRLPWVLSCALVLAHATPTRAAAGDDEKAKALFDEARDLAKAGKWAEACEKLEASKKLVPKMLTTYRLADCHERVGRTASAHAGFLTAAELAKAVGDAARQQDAIDRAKLIEGKLSRVVLDLPTDEKKLVVKIDGAPIPAALTTEKLPLDPGEHALVVTAEGKQPYAVSFHVPPGPAVTTVTVSALDPLDGKTEPTKPEPPKEVVEPQPAAAPVTDTAPAASPLKTAGFVALGVGVVGLGVGTWLGLSAKSLDRDAEALCTARGCTPEGKQLNDDARSRGNLATIVFSVGAVAAVSGVIMVLVAPSSAPKTAAITPWVGAGTGGLQVSGSF